MKLRRKNLLLLVLVALAAGCAATDPQVLRDWVPTIQPVSDFCDMGIS
jgi:type IV pilus biogenesis protein CpaD/CtpE